MDYYKKKIGDKHYIIHRESGASIPYNGGRASYERVPEYKRKYFLGYLSMSRKQRKKSITEERGLKPSQVTTDNCHTHTVSLGTLSAVTMDMMVYPDYPKTKKEETPMRTLEQEQKDYLNRRLYGAFNKKDCELSKAFGLTDLYPKDTEEAVKFIQEGKFVIRDADEDIYDDYSYGRLQWKDHSVKKDRDGYDEAIKAAKLARTAAEDMITVGTPEAGLKALQEFEATTFH